MAVPGDGTQPVSVTHCEDVAKLVGSVVGRESMAGNEIFNCGTDTLCTYNDICAAAARGLGKSNALVAALPAGTRAEIEFFPSSVSCVLDVVIIPTRGGKKILRFFF